MSVTVDPVLYSFRRCPYAMRARLALLVSRTRCELREVKLSAKPQAMLAASPKATVPVIVLPNGQVLDESLDIMRWALENRDPEGWLLREDAALIVENDSRFKHDLDRYKYPDRFGADPVVHRDRGLVFLRELDSRLAGEGQLCGPVRGLTDAAVVPFVRQFAAISPKWFAVQPLTYLLTWLHGHLASDLFNAVMIREPEWRPGNGPRMLALMHQELPSPY